MITERMLSRRASSYVFDNPLATASCYGPLLRARFQPDLLIAMTHIGIRQDRELAAQTEGIDLIIGGHTHVTLPEGERIGNTLIVQTGCFGKHLGRVEAEKDSVGGRITLCATL